MDIKRESYQLYKPISKSCCSATAFFAAICVGGHNVDAHCFLKLYRRKHRFYHTLLSDFTLGQYDGTIRFKPKNKNQGEICI